MENILKMKLCDNIKVDNLVISLRKSSSNTNPKWPVIAAFSNLFKEVWTETIHFEAFSVWKT